MTTDNGEGLAELLETKNLTDPDVLDVTAWRNDVAPVTRPFIDQIASALGWSDIKKYAAQPTKTKRRHFDNLMAEFGDLFAFVTIGFADEPGGNLEHSLAWGVGAWGRGNPATIDEREVQLRALGLPGFEVRRINGVRAGDFGGTTILLHKRVSPSELRARSLAGLTHEIVSDLHRMRKMVEAMNGPTGLDGAPSLTAGNLANWLLEAHGLNFTPYQVASVVTALQAKGFVILSGISGTGKTQMAVRIAELVIGKAPEVIPVRPDWHDSRSLLGYFNPITERYVSTPLLRQLLTGPQTPPKSKLEGNSSGLVDFTRVRQKVQEAGVWVKELRTLVESVEDRDPQDLSEAQLGEIWRVRSNGVCDIGQAAGHPLQVPVDQLRQATALLKNGSTGARLIAAYRYLREQAGRQHWARVLRALATFDLDHTCVVARKSSLEAALHFLGYDHPFDLASAVQMGDVESIDHAFGFLRTCLDERLPGLNRYEKAIAPWFISQEPAGEISEQNDGTDEKGNGVDQTQHQFIILDEMNLARVEYYFAEFLSVLESDRDPDTGATSQALPLHGERRPVKDGSDDNPAAIDVPSELSLPPRLYVVGTVNTDETTHAFSPKVLDRAFSIEFNDVDLGKRGGTSGSPQFSLGDGLVSLLEAAWGPGREAALNRAMDDRRLIAWLNRLNQSLRPYGFQFGYRVRDEIARFVGFAMTSPLGDGFRDDTNNDVFVGAFDAATLMKVLPKFHGPRAKIAEPLVRVLAWALNPDAPDANRSRIEKALGDADVTSLHSLLTVPNDIGNQGTILYRVAEKSVQMLYEVRTTGFTSYA